MGTRAAQVTLYKDGAVCEYCKRDFELLEQIGPDARKQWTCHGRCIGHRLARRAACRCRLLQKEFRITAVLFPRRLDFQSMHCLREPAFGRRSSVCAFSCVLGSRTAGAGG